MKKPYHRTSRAYILDDRSMVGVCDDDPIAVYGDHGITIDMKNYKGMCARQARHLAYLLCELVDAEERS